MIFASRANPTLAEIIVYEAAPSAATAFSIAFPAVTSRRSSTFIWSSFYARRYRGLAQ
jgi:hypothetical protein